MTSHPRPFVCCAICGMQLRPGEDVELYRAQHDDASLAHRRCLLAPQDRELIEADARQLYERRDLGPAWEAIPEYVRNVYREKAANPYGAEVAP